MQQNQARFFGAHLVLREIITTADLRSALEEQRANRPSEANTAVALGLVTAERAMAIEDDACMSCETFLGHAERSGALSPRQVREVRAAQWSNGPRIGEVLVRRGVLRRQVVDAELRLFNARRNQRTKQRLKRALGA